jgi:hypothetical protein
MDNNPELINGLLDKNDKAAYKWGENALITIKNKLSLDATTLKIIAVILMVLDHIHQMWAHTGAPMWLTWLGRPVFPIFLFAISESFYYTRNRRKLLLRLLCASWLMTAINFVLGGFVLPNPSIILMNNAFTTFFVATLYMLFWDMLVKGVKERKAKSIIAAVLLCFVPILTMIPILFVSNIEAPPSWLMRTLFFIPNILLVEGGPLMVATGVLFYVFRRWRWAQIGVLAAVAALVFAVNPSIQWIMIFALIPMLLYNGEKGRGMKSFFYIFYPAHIYLLYIVASLWK